MTASFPSPSYQTMPLQYKYDMMHSGPGGVAAVPAADTLGKLAPDFNASADAVQRALSFIGVSWEGQAATAFTGAMRQAGQWAQRQGSQTSQSGGGQVYSYASSYDATKAKIPDPRTLAPVGEPSLTDRFMDWSGGPFGAQSDWARHRAAFQAADRQANDALLAHENTTRRVLDAFPTIGNAPPMTAGAGGAQPGTPGAGPHGAGGPGA
ncbi:MAG TPA: PPE domain-containing protein, partial [Pseudonocardiaceae bacterium]|nr:PPE domain-containing protein [Pseudonocardiaceae bacterium]